tara:strand:- start:945 stop:2204 length:1260 start_codon:yes stop_codon:yes gene_type:complete
MLSKQAFNALLKTLEEPPQYLKFIFATTEIKKIPITVVSRCQRFDLSRIKSFELFEFIKKIKDKENGKVSDDALKLIVKISEGSVRDALSLLDRALVSLDKDVELDLKNAQKIFGYFDKSNLIRLFKYIFEGDEKKVIEIYRSIYDQGIEPKIFINDFLELLYYFKNISSLKIEGTNFSLNDEEFDQIKEISKDIENKTLLLFWQFTIKTLEEIEIVSNQHIAIEMFLLRLIHLKEILNLTNEENNNLNKEDLKKKNQLGIEKKDLSSNAIGQIKNIVQEKTDTEKSVPKLEKTEVIKIKTFDDLIEICNLKKEINLKYELETNVNLVSFSDQLIEISFNDKLDKEFIKNLSSKLYEWTKFRWIISLSKQNGEPSKKEKNILFKKKLLDESKKTNLYKKVMDSFPEAELIDVNIKKNND